MSLEMKIGEEFRKRSSLGKIIRESRAWPALPGSAFPKPL